MSACSRNDCLRLIGGNEFTAGEIAAAVANNRLLSIELETTHACNLRCVYCYSSAGSPLAGEMTLEGFLGAVDQAADLGARKVVLLGGGEPLVYSRLRDLVAHIVKLGLCVELFTNGTLIDAACARFLYDHGVGVVVKKNATRADIQDELAGVPGAFARIEEGLANLMEAGYPDASHGLGIQSVICRANYDEIPLLWVWARSRNIQPYIEALTVQGRALNNNSLHVSPFEVGRMFKKLSEIDRNLYGRQWDARPPIAASACSRHLYSLLIRSNGDVCPCVGVDLPVGNVANVALRHIVAHDPILQKLRSIYDNIKGECRSCHFNGQCYGCRGNAYQITGDYLAADPTCWIAGAAHE